MMEREKQEPKYNSDYPTYVINDASWGQREDPYITTGQTIVDCSGTGRVQPWNEKSRKGKEELSVVYDVVNRNKAVRLRNCATTLLFARYVNPQGDKRLKLKNANFCRVRLCPMCAWRRSEKIFGQVSKIMQSMEVGDYAYIFASFTVRNCTGDKLSKTLDDMMAAWNRLAGYKPFKAAVKGWYRSLEVRHQMDRTKPNFDTYHPHFHCIFVVNQSYFTNAEYLSHAKWLKLWQDAARLEYRPSVDVRRVKGNTAKAVAEIAKYTVKEDDYISPGDWDLSVETVRVLDAALDRRRLVAFGGVMKEWHQRLKLDDAVDGDLAEIGDDPAADGYIDIGIQECFMWCPGYVQYRKIVH